MALDKLVDSTKLDAALTYTADRIRLKTGGSADLDFDYEGGTGFGDDVDAIPTGGGDVPVATGTLTPASNVSSFTLSIEFEPVLFVLVCDPNDLPSNNTWKVSSLQMLIPAVFTFGAITRTNNGALQTQGGTGGTYVYSNGTFSVSGFLGSRSLTSGVTYKWYAIGSSA